MLTLFFVPKKLTLCFGYCRDEIAGCSEKVYDYLSFADAKKMLMFSSDQELLTYAEEVHLPFCS